MKQTAIIMGMPISIELPHTHGAVAPIHDVLTWFQEVDETFSTYKPTSEISRINTGELQVEQASRHVREVLHACDELYIRSNRVFDIRRNGIIDPSGYVKGWAIARAVALLENRAISDYFLNVGGDIAVSGNGPEGAPWVVGVRSPYSRQEIIKRLTMTRGGVATSGAYERGEHIYNPVSNETPQAFSSITIVGPDIMLADIYATIVFAMGEPGLAWLATQGDYEAYIVVDTTTAFSTPGLNQYLAS